MPQVNLSEILADVPDKNAVGAFNVHNLEFVRGVIAAAEKANSNVIVMINEGVLKYAELELLGRCAIEAAKNSKVNVAVMVDHGKDVEYLYRCLDFGMDVMFDGSLLPLSENIEITRKLAEYAHKLGRAVEGEIGALGQTEEGDSCQRYLTTKEEAVIFSSSTKLDVLAVSVGNAHGFYKGRPNIDTDRIRSISEAVKPVPVVMHGGSGIPNETVGESITAGIKKFNIATELKFAYSMKMRELMAKEPLVMQPIQIFPHLTDAVADITYKKIMQFKGQGDN